MIIALSILDVDKSLRKAMIKQFESINKDNFIHFDIMDGEFVSNTSFNEEVVTEVKSYSNLFRDVHLMVKDPENYLNRYKDAGAQQITFHFEAVDKEKISPLIEQIKSLGLKVGISLKPSTKIELIRPYLSELDYVLVMSVEPGLGGQKYLSSATSKIEELKQIKEANDFNYLIAVDGGINLETSRIVKDAGADVIIVGSFLSKQSITEELLSKLS